MDRWVWQAQVQDKKVAKNQASPNQDVRKYHSPANHGRKRLTGKSRVQKFSQIHQIFGCTKKRAEAAIAQSMLIATFGAIVAIVEKATATQPCHFPMP